MTTRAPAFVGVGAAGFVLQLGVLYVLVTMLRWPYPLATALAVESAVLNNFVWHERWTWRDRPATGADRLRRLCRFHVGTGLISIAGNVVVTALLVEWCGMPPLVANAAAVAVTSAANFAVADRWVFARGDSTRRNGEISCAAP
ncbi:MAG: GtrA family protein [Vicinamibacterales bacterium]